MHNQISGALYDFLGYLTSRPDSFEVGKQSEVQSIMDIFARWAKERGLDIEDNPDIKNWQVNLGTAEGLIEFVIKLGEFYSVPLEPMGDHTGGAIGGYPGRKDDTNFSKRRKWMDAREGAVSNDGVGSERDVVAPLYNAGRNHAEDMKRRYERLLAQRPDLRPEDFGMAGLPGGTRNDPESPNDYVQVPQARLRSK